MKNLMLTLSMTMLTTAVLAAPSAKLEINTVEVPAFESEAQMKGAGPSGSGSGAGPIIPDLGIGNAGVGGSTPSAGAGKFGLDNVGQVIAIAKDIVALGEGIYNLVQKGKPSNTSEYAPVSIVPKDPMTKEALDPFELENCTIPVQKKFKTSMTTGGVEVVKFEYMVLYTYGCSWNGAGNYIQAAIIQPVSVKTSYGWDFNASMKLSGIMNHGTKTDPNVGAMLTVKYSMNSWRTAFERNDTIHITGKGEFKTYSR